MRRFYAVLDNTQNSNKNINSIDTKTNFDAIILMAGEGRRLLPLTSDRPKALLLCNDGVSIFEHTLRSLINGFSDIKIIPVIGHGRLKVLEETNRLSKFASFLCATNPFYSTAGPLISLWLGLIHTTSERVMVINGDTIIRPSLVEKAKVWLTMNSNEQRQQIGLCITKTNDLKKDDMKISIDHKNSFIKAGKEIMPGLNVMKSAGVMCIRSSIGKNLLKDKLELLLMENKTIQKNYYWHYVLNEIKDLFSIELIQVDSQSWCEIDTRHDLSRFKKNSYIPNN